MKLEELHSDQKYPKKAKGFLRRQPTKGPHGAHQAWAVPTKSAMVAPKKTKSKISPGNSGEKD